jgi:hypothetical protein
MVTLGDPSFFGGRTAAQQDARPNGGHALVKETQAGTFMHELGHTLGLTHVGTENWDGSSPRDHSAAVTEHAATYKSVMNYRYQGGGIGFKDPVTHQFVSNAQILDYSEAAPNEWTNLWFAFQENPQSLAGGDTSTDPDDDPTTSRPTLDPSVDDLVPIVDPKPSSMVAVGDSVPVTFDIVNLGPATAAGSTFTLSVPITFAVGTVTVSQGTVKVSGHTIVASLGDIANLAGAALSVTVTPTQPGTFTLTGQAASTTTDGVPDNNTADTGTFLVNGLPSAAVQSVVINDASAQRSKVGSITVTFTRAVDLSRGAFTLLRTSRGTTADVSRVVSVMTALTADGRTVAKLTFAGAGILGGSLEDGQYALTIHGDQVHDHLLGAPLDGDLVDHFFRLFGDVNGDGRVDRTDLKAFLRANPSRRGMAKYRGYFDFNGDGLINSLDYVQFLRRQRTALRRSAPH